VEDRGPSLFERCAEAAAAGATIGEITRAVRINDTPCDPITPVCISRAAEPVERLRAAMDRFFARTQQRPQVFLCNMGPLREHKARADFARGFFGVGGYEVMSPAGFKTPEAAADAFAQTNVRIAVICSTDDNYPALVPALVSALRARRPDALIILAGYPQDQVEAHKKAGVDDFIHIRADAVQLLSQFHQRLGIE
jgi:methylmalonyl-CoA mutase